MPNTPVVSRLKNKPFAKLFVADEVRIENNGKLMVIGLYSDGVVLFRVPKNAPPPTQDMPYGLDSLALVAVVGGYEGETSVRISLGKSKPIEQPLSLKAGRAANLHLAIKPFRFASFGVKVLNVEFGDAKFKLPFEVRAEYVDPVEDLGSFMEVVTKNTTRQPMNSGVEDARIVTPREKRPKAKPRAKRF